MELIRDRARTLISGGSLGFTLGSGAIALAAAIAVLIARCVRAYSRAAPLQLLSRRLSEGGVPQSSAGLIACGETSGLGSGDDLQGGDLELPPAKKAKVEDESSYADAGAGFKPRISASGQEESTIAAGGASAGAAAVAAEAQSTLESRRSSEEVTAAEALIALVGQQSPAFSEQFPPVLALKQQEQLSPAPPPQAKLFIESDQHAQLSHALQEQMQLHLAFQQQAQVFLVSQHQAAAAPPLALESGPPLLGALEVAVQGAVPLPSLSASPPAEVGRHHPQAAPVQFASPLSGAAPQAPIEASSEAPSQAAPTKRPSCSRKTQISSEEGREIIDPLTEWEPPPPSEAGGKAIVEHPFSRLPRVPVGNASAYSSFIDPQRAVSSDRARTVTCSSLQELRRLLAQEELSSSQMLHLAALTERLLSHLAFNEFRQVGDYPAQAVGVLGYRFLLLDMAVSSLHLLGVPCSGSWWADMVSRIPDTYRHSFKRRNEEVAKFNARLMFKLTEAIKILKAGQRPSPKVVVQLKRCLFCSNLSPIRFLKPAWEPWREANKQYYQQFGGRPGQRDPGQPGPSHQSFP
ncbi:hypothetical protein ACSSS7_000396 [Eimeria intestinalis]